MNIALEAVQHIHLYDGDRTEPIWVPSENYSTYDCEELASQCSVPLPSIEELRRELDL